MAKKDELELENKILKRLLAEFRAGAKPRDPADEPNWREVKSRCPHCGHIGPVLPDFGLRNDRGRTYKTSWCKDCRATTNYHRRQRKYYTARR